MTRGTRRSGTGGAMRADGVIDSPWLRQCGQPRQHSPHGPHSPARVAGQPHPADADADGHG
ncbi:hypothetical protein, partial [Streptomyces clavuligerus]|uniref:hypothetical protein n=1 Tax=Streptomyces clavuligerus TaxID=1901 RepID=UPI001E2F6766